ncbi:MAG TPA: sugar MFS transporter [Bacteroidales bacterium]|nr:sugar MFS transporter [Bacteroidales bacterium]HPS16437.1 sugar MFS transporter [Bacteroidales bacterium]
MTKLNSRKDYVISIFIIGILYFVFGFITWLNSTLIPFLKTSCELNNTQAYFVTLAFYISYFVMALPSSWVLKKTGFKGGMSFGLIIMAIGSLMFIPAAITRTYGLFISGLFIQGTGLCILQTAVNPYVTILGPIESAAKRISIMGICNKIAGFMGPLVLSAIVLKNFEAIETQLNLTVIPTEKEILLSNLAERVIFPYIIIAALLLILAFFIKLSPIPDIDISAENGNNDAQEEKTSILNFPHLLLGFVAIFLYVGAEVISIDTITLYGKSQGVLMDNARLYPLMPLFGMVIGYILGIILIPKYINQGKALGISAILALIFSLLAVYTNGFTSVLFIAALGFANAIMWPAIWPLAINGLGKFTKSGSAILIMGIAGGATIPLLYGRLVDISSIGSQQAYLILLPCYLFILYYAYKGHKVGLNKKNVNFMAN